MSSSRSAAARAAGRRRVLHDGSRGARRGPRSGGSLVEVEGAQRPAALMAASGSVHEGMMRRCWVPSCPHDTDDFDSAQKTSIQSSKLQSEEKPPLSSHVKRLVAPSSPSPPFCRGAQPQPSFFPDRARPGVRPSQPALRTLPWFVSSRPRRLTPSPPPGRHPASQLRAGTKEITAAREQKPREVLPCRSACVNPPRRWRRTVGTVRRCCSPVTIPAA